MDAFASPIKYNGEIVEYQSVRFKPERIYVKRAEKAYAKLRNDKKPLQLYLPRTRLWMRAAFFLFISNFFGLVTSRDESITNGGFQRSSVTFGIIHLHVDQTN